LRHVKESSAASKITFCASDFRDRLMTTLLALSKTEEAFSKTERSEVQRRGSLSNRAKRDPREGSLSKAKARSADGREDRDPPLALRPSKARD